MNFVIYKSEGKSINEEVLRKAFEMNPMGGGLAYPSGGSIRIQKVFSKFNKFYNTYLKATEEEKKEILISFWSPKSKRVDLDAVNVPPFDVLGRGAVALTEGVYALEDLLESRVSETKLFKNYLDSIVCNSSDNSEDALDKLFLDRNFSKYLQASLSRSKGVIIRYGKPVIILNRAQGFDIDGNWYSDAPSTIEAEHKRLSATNQLELGYATPSPNNTPRAPVNVVPINEKVPIEEEQCIYCKDVISTASELAVGICTSCEDHPRAYA